MDKPLSTPETFDPNYEEKRTRFIPAKAAPARPDPSAKPRRLAPHQTPAEEALPQAPADTSEEQRTE